MRPLATRILALCLAVLPTVWGNCPCWFTDAMCCGEPVPLASQAPSKAAPPPCCPRCAHRAQAPRVAEAPTPEPERTGCPGCEGCPTLTARFACAPVPAALELPAGARGPFVALLPCAPRLGLRALDTAPRRIELEAAPPGPPRPHETTVLRS